VAQYLRKYPLLTIALVFGIFLLWFADASPHLLQGQLGFSYLTYYMADAVIRGFDLPRTNDTLHFFAAGPIIILQFLAFITVTLGALHRTRNMQLPEYAWPLGIATAFIAEAGLLGLLWKLITLPYPQWLVFFIAILVLLAVVVVLYVLATMMGGFTRQEITESYTNASIPRKIGAIGFVILGIGMLIFFFALLGGVLINPFMIATIATLAVIGGTCVYIGVSAMPNGTAQ
jgi:hypothetical protein